MPFARPTLKTLRERILTDIDAHLPGADSRLRRSVLNVLGGVLAAAGHGLYGYIAYLAKQILADSAVEEWLERHAGIWGISRKAATRAEGTVTATGTPGVVVTAGTLLLRGDDVEVETLEETELAGGTAELALRARQPGSLGNAEAGQAYRFVSPPAGVVNLATGGAFTGGADSEGDAALRARLLSRIRQPPHGGADFDYVTWALQVPGVTRAWVYPRELGLGTVTVRFMMDTAQAENDGIPQGDAKPDTPSGDIAAVQAHIDALRPVTAEVYVVAPVPVELDVIVGELASDTLAVRAAIEAELADLIRRVAVPGGTVYVSKIWEAVSLASGEEKHKILFPPDDVEHLPGQLAIPGTVSFG